MGNDYLLYRRVSASLGKVFMFFSSHQVEGEDILPVAVSSDDQKKYLNPLYSSQSQKSAVLEPNTVSFNFK